MARLLAKDPRDRDPISLPFLPGGASMLPLPSSARQSAATDQPAQAMPIGVGIDTSRYGHYAAFVRENLQPAAAELSFVESATGYAQLRERLEQVATRHGCVHFIVRLDAAAQYADNLLQSLPPH